RAKIRALSGDPKTTVETFADNLSKKNYHDRNAELHGYTLALLRNQQYDQARAQSQQLIKRQPNNVHYRITAAEIEMAAGNYRQALTQYADTYKKSPENLALLKNYSAALLKTEKFKEARTVVKKAIRIDADDPELHRMMATAAGQSGYKLEAHQAMAEHYYLNGNTGSAIQQLELANRYAGDSFYLRASLEARIKTIKEEAERYKPH
ncbi:MAG: tetratricopeptide repeat protein, partial [Gammaproteobacteria bacterium]|nr:tetratricopeptide repeat protein [Gammaproteobacteria bacterium]